MVTFNQPPNLARFKIVVVDPHGYPIHQTPSLTELVLYLETSVLFTMDFPNGSVAGIIIVKSCDCPVPECSGFTLQMSPDVYVLADGVWLKFDHSQTPIPSWQNFQNRMDQNLLD